VNGFIGLLIGSAPVYCEGLLVGSGIGLLDCAMRTGLRIGRLIGRFMVRPVKAAIISLLSCGRLAIDAEGTVGRAKTGFRDMGGNA